MFNLTRILAALLVLAALVLAGYAWVLSRKPDPAAQAAATRSAPQPPQHTVVVAARPIAAGQPIQPEDLRTVQLGINPVGAFKDTQGIVGQTPTLPLGVDTPVLAQHLAAGLATLIEPGERALAVKMDEVSSVGNRVRPGDYVDVFFALKRDNGEIDRSQARMLLSRKRVLAYGPGSLDGPAPPNGKAASSAAAAPRTEQARTAVLAIRVEEVNAVLLAEAHGRLSLTLRNPSDAAVPTADLYPSWPTVLQPALARGPKDAAATPVAEPQGADRALGGLAMESLAQGAQALRGAAGARRLPAAPLAHRAGAAAPPPSGPSVEVIRSGQVDTVRLP